MLATSALWKLSDFWPSRQKDHNLLLCNLADSSNGRDAVTLSTNLSMSMCLSLSFPGFFQCQTQEGLAETPEVKILVIGQ